VPRGPSRRCASRAAPECCNTPSTSVQRLCPATILRERQLHRHRCVDADCLLGRVNRRLRWVQRLVEAASAVEFPVARAVDPRQQPRCSLGDAVGGGNQPVADRTRTCRTPIIRLASGPVPRWPSVGYDVLSDATCNRSHLRLAFVSVAGPSIEPVVPAIVAAPRRQTMRASIALPGRQVKSSLLSPRL